MDLQIIPLHTRAPAQRGTLPAKSELGGISFTVTTLDTFKDGVETKTTKDQVFGRTDPMEYYEGTNRKVSFEFQIGGSSADDAAIESNARAVALFMQLQYPAYSYKEGVRGPVLAAPPLFNVRLLKNEDKVFDEIGYISGLGYQGGAGTTAKALRNTGGLVGVKTYNLSFDFSVIHRDIAGFDIDLRSFRGDTRLKAPNANPFYPFNQIAK